MEPFIIWQENYNVAIPSINRQHKRIVNSINYLFDHVYNDQEIDFIRRILKVLLGYTKSHCRYEEILLRRVSFPHLTNHMFLHKSIIEKTATICEELQSSKSNVPQEIFILLKDMWIDHIVKEDAQFVECLLEDFIR